MKIERIDQYRDIRFDQDVLNEHGAYLIDDHLKVSFKIISKDSARVVYDEGVDIYLLIDRFRFYSEHIIHFYDIHGQLIKSYQSPKLIKIAIDDLQPSQFLVDMDKYKAVSTFIKKADDVVIAICKLNGEYIARDGHSRLLYAVNKGFQTVLAYMTDQGDCLQDFVEGAKERKVYRPHQLKLVDHDTYDKIWNGFCDEVFEDKEESC